MIRSIGHGTMLYAASVFLNKNKTPIMLSLRSITFNSFVLTDVNLHHCLICALYKEHLVLTEKPAQKGQECRTLGDVVRARAAKLTARMRLPKTIWETPRASMILVRVRYSLRRERLRDSDAGLREPGPPMPLLLPPPRGNAFTGIVTGWNDK